MLTFAERQIAVQAALRFPPDQSGNWVAGYDGNIEDVLLALANETPVLG
jgi:hypothetical protein